MAAMATGYNQIAAADDFMATKALAIPFAGSAYNWNDFYAGGPSRRQLLWFHAHVYDLRMTQEAGDSAVYFWFDQFQTETLLIWPMR